MRNFYVFRKNEKKKEGSNYLESSVHSSIHEQYPNAQIRAFGFKRSTWGRLENLGESLPPLQVHAPRGGKCKRWRRVPRRKAPRQQGGLREEEMRGSRTFSRKEAASGTETEEIRAPGVCTLFRVSARAGNMTAVTSAWIFEGGETSKEHVLRR